MLSVIRPVSLFKYDMIPLYVTCNDRDIPYSFSNLLFSSLQPLPRGEFSGNLAFRTWPANDVNCKVDVFGFESIDFGCCPHIQGCLVTGCPFLREIAFGRTLLEFMVDDLKFTLRCNCY